MERRRKKKNLLSATILKTYTGLLAHRSTIHEFKKIECTHNEALFTQSMTLKRHISTIHDKIKSFQCTLCNATSTQKARLMTHISSVHEGKKPHECPICKEKFAHQTGMANHMKRAHSKNCEKSSEISNQKQSSSQTCNGYLVNPTSEQESNDVLKIRKIDDETESNDSRITEHYYSSRNEKADQTDLQKKLNTEIFRNKHKFRSHMTKEEIIRTHKINNLTDNKEIMNSIVNQLEQKDIISMTKNNIPVLALDFG